MFFKKVPFRKKAYFFLIDAFVGSTIIFFSLAIIFSADVTGSKIQFDYALAEDYATFMMNSKIEDLNSLYVNNFTITGIIKNTKNTVIEQIDEFYYTARYLCTNGTNISCVNSNLNNAQGLIQNLTDPLVNPKYGFKFTLQDNTLNINQTIYSRGEDRLNISKGVIVSKKITYLQIDESTLFGPKIIEIKIWV